MVFVRADGQLRRSGEPSRKTAEAVVKGPGQFHERRDFQRLGTKLSVVPLRLEPAIDVGLGPQVRPDLRESVPHEFAPMQE